MRRFILALLVFTLASPALAGTKACTQPMVDAGICRDAANVVLYFDAPIAFWLSMAVGICSDQSYQEEIDGAPNPESCNQFAQRWIKERLLAFERDPRSRGAGEAASDVVQAEPDADVGDGS